MPLVRVMISQMTTVTLTAVAQAYQLARNPESIQLPD
jgi:hypothetical protein